MRFLLLSVLLLSACTKRSITSPVPPLGLGTTSIGVGPLDLPAPEGAIRPLLERAELRDGQVVAVGHNSNKGRWARSLQGDQALRVFPAEALQEQPPFALLPQFALLADGGYVEIEGQHSVAHNADGTERFRVPIPGATGPFSLTGSQFAMLAVSADGQTIAVMNAQAVQLLDATGAVRWEMEPRGMTAARISLSPLGNRLMLVSLASHGAQLEELSLEDGSILRTTKLWSGSERGELAWVGEEIYLAGIGGDLQKVDLDAPDEGLLCAKVPRPIASVFRHHDRLYLAGQRGDVVSMASCGEDVQLHGTLPTGARADLVGLFPEDDGFVAVLRDGEIFRLDRALQIRGPLPAGGLPLTAALSPQGDRLALTVAGGALRLYDLRAGTLRLLDADTCAIDLLAFSPDGTKLHQGTCKRERSSIQPKSRLVSLDGAWSVEVEGGKGAWSASGVLWAPVGTQLVPIRSVVAHPKELGCALLAAGRDEDVLLGLCNDGRVLSDAGRELVGLDVVPEPGPFLQLVDLPGERHFGVLSEGWLTDCERGKCTRIAIPGEQVGAAVAVTSRGVLVFEQAEDGSYRLRNLDTGERAPLDSVIPIGLATSADGARLAILYQDRVRVHDVADLRFTAP